MTTPPHWQRILIPSFQSQRLTEHGKLSRDPLMSLKKPDPKTDRRLERRMLLLDEWDYLSASIIRLSAERFRVESKERVTLYATAIQTGLRSSELRSLTAARLFLDTDTPYITCKAGSTKNLTEARQYIKPDPASTIVELVSSRRAGHPVFKMPHETDVAEMLRRDVDAARQEWLADVRRDAHEHARRSSSDFLCVKNHDGAVLDFHALRHTCGAWLAKAGNHPKVVQTIMRHSTITLTMDTYGHLFPGQASEAVAKLPEMVPSQWKRQCSDDKNSQVLAAQCSTTRVRPGKERSRKASSESDLRLSSRGYATPGINGATGTRTQNQRIMSPLL